MRNFNEMVIKRYIPNDVETKDLKKISILHQGEVSFMLKFVHVQILHTLLKC